MLALFMYMCLYDLSIVHFFRIQVVVGEAVPRYFFPFGAGLAVVAVWVNGDAAARCKFAPHFDVFWFHQFDEVFHDDVYAVFVKITVVAETEQIQLQGFAFYHPFTWDVGNINGGKVRLACHWAQAGKFGTVKFYEIIVVRVFVWEGFQHFRCVVTFVYGVLVAQ